MTFTLETVVPWGRSFEEYQALFALSESDLGQRILGGADGPASFNATLTQRGGRVVSVDPLYAFSDAEIQSRIDATYDVVLEQTRTNAHEFVWQHIPNVEALGRIRRAAMEAFLADYPAGRAVGRYQAASLPTLPFDDGAFDLALCSHFLFLYSAHFDEPFHLAALRELCRVAREARIFPLLELGSQPSRHLAAVIAQLTREGYTLRVETVSYEFQRGGNQMLRVSGPLTP